MTATEDLLAAFEPYLGDDDGSLVALLEAMASGLEDVDEVVRDRDDAPGWAAMLDADRAPAWALPWLGQFVGVQVSPGADPAATRTAIRTPAGWRRGTPGAIADAVRPLLTGTRSVWVLERQAGAWAAGDNPYHFTVRTFTDETPDTAAVTAAVAAQKPAGMVALVQTITRNSYATREATYATYAPAETALAHYSDAEVGL